MPPGMSLFLPPEIDLVQMNFDEIEEEKESEEEEEIIEEFRSGRERRMFIRELRELLGSLPRMGEVGLRGLVVREKMEEWSKKQKSSNSFLLPLLPSTPPPLSSHQLPPVSTRERRRDDVVVEISFLEGGKVVQKVLMSSQSTISHLSSLLSCPLHPPHNYHLPDPDTGFIMGEYGGGEISHLVDDIDDQSLSTPLFSLPSLKVSPFSIFNFKSSFF